MEGVDLPEDCGGYEGAAQVDDEDVDNANVDETFDELVVTVAREVARVEEFVSGKGFDNAVEVVLDEDVIGDDVVEEDEVDKMLEEDGVDDVDVDAEDAVDVEVLEETEGTEIIDDVEAGCDKFDELLELRLDIALVELEIRTELEIGLFGAELDEVRLLLELVLDVVLELVLGIKYDVMLDVVLELVDRIRLEAVGEVKLEKVLFENLFELAMLVVIDERLDLITSCLILRAHLRRAWSWLKLCSMYLTPY